MGFIDYWLIALFLLTTDILSKILVTSDYSAVEFNDERHFKVSFFAGNDEFYPLSSLFFFYCFTDWWLIV